MKSHATEKAGRMKSENKYIFAIDKSLNKSEIKKLLKREYKVDALGVNILKTGKLKKAIITLKPGEVINEKV